VRPEERANLTEIELAVGDTLEEYTQRVHGVLSPAEPTWFLDWLRERGYEVIAGDRTGGGS
jgi:hypothetical protein